MFNETFDIEAHVASGGTDNLEFEGEDAEADLNKILGVFAKLNLPLSVMNRGFNLYGLAGYGYARVDILAETTTDTVTENSFAWGAKRPGGQWFVACGLWIAQQVKYESASIPVSYEGARPR